MLNSILLTDSTHAPRNETRYEENEQNTAGLVAVLMVGVTSIFMAFAGAALCYRSRWTTDSCAVLSSSSTHQLLLFAVRCDDKVFAWVSLRDFT